MQKPFATLCRAPVSSTDIQGEVSNPARSTSRALGEEAIMLLGQQALELAFGDRQADRLQQGCQPRQRGLALMVLHQHEAAQVRAEVPLGRLGQRRDDGLSARVN